MAAPQDPNPNRIDVSLNLVSDAAQKAIDDLTKSVSGLRELIAASGMVNPAAAAQATGQAAGYVQPGGLQAGIWHGRSQPVFEGDSSNPSQGAQRSQQRRRELRDEYEAYMRDIENRAAGLRGESQLGPELPLSPEASSMMSQNLSDLQRFRFAGQEKRVLGGSRLDRFFSMYPGVQRDPNEDRTFEDVAQVPRRGGSALPEGITTQSGRVSSGASVGGPTGGGYTEGNPWAVPGGAGGGNRPPNIPPAPSSPDDFGGNTDGGGPNQPGWAAALGREGITPESRLGLTIPRLGEFTIQDKLNMYAQWVGRAAMRRQDALEPGETLGSGGQFMGRSAAGAAYLRDQSASLVAIGREFQRLRGFARGEELGGEQLGFSRESALGDLEIGGAGIRLNLGVTSAAQREALHQEFTQRRVQAAAGVSGDEAQRIRQLVSGMGYSGDLNANLQMNLFRNLQQRGIAPESVAPLVDQGLRQGNSSIGALRDILYDLADAARHAHMTVEELANSTAEYAEQAQELGANYEDALRNAAVYTRMGVDPRIMGQAQQSPMVQGILSARTGLVPQLQGTLGAPIVAQGTARAIDMALAMGQGFSNMPDQTMTTASGETITVGTGRDAQIAFAAQQSGVPRQIVERYMKNPDFLQAGAIAGTMAQQANTQLRALTNQERTRVVTERGPGPNQPAGRFGTSYGHNGPLIRRTITDSVHRDLTDADRQRLQHGQIGDGVVSYDELEAQMIAMDPTNNAWKDRVRKISKDHSGVEERIKVASRIIGEANETKPEPDYLVGLTDEAAKALVIVKPKDRTSALPRANGGGTPANSGYLGPNFSSGTGGALSYGRPGP